MSDIKCPLCGKTNPAEEDVCQRCGARLKQLGESRPGASEPGSHDDSLDWLKELSADGSSEDLDEEIAPGLQRAGTDWFQQIPDQLAESGDPDIGSNDLFAERPSMDVPDWISELAAVGDESIEAGDDREDWLGGLRPQAEPDMQAQEEQEDAQEFLTGVGPEEEPLDLLSRLDMGQQVVHQEQSNADQFLTSSPDESLTPPHGGEDEDIPNWLSGLESWAPSEPLEEPGAGEKLPQVSDIFPSLSQDAAKYAEAENEGWLDAEKDGEISSTGLEDDLDISDLLKALDEEEKPFAQIFEDEDKLLDRLDAGAVLEDSEETPKSEAEAASDVVPENGDELPAWLGFEDGKESEVVERSPETVMPLEDVLPVWLSDFDASETTDGRLSDAEDALPQWLQDEKNHEETEEKTLIAAASEDARPQDGIKAEQSVPEIPVSEEEKLPEWLRLEGYEKPEDPGISLFVSEQDDLDEWLGEPQDETIIEKPLKPAETVELTAADEIIAETVETASDDKPVGVSPFEGVELAGWMSEVQEEISSEDSSSETQEAVLQEKSQEHPFASEEFPDWFLEGSQDEPIEKTGEEPELDADEIELAQLPGWLAAMRPLDVVPTGDLELLDDKKIEQSGPLAGMRAVIPAEGLVTRYRKPPIYSVKLQVTDKQRAHATMLESVLEESRRSPEKGASRKKPSLNLMRIIIGVLLIAVVLLSLFTDLQGSPLGDIPTTGEIWKFVDQVENVPVGRPVLVAVDFDPGFFGEMRFLATGVLRRLMMREIRIVTVSTVPAGPVLAEGLKSAALELSTGHVDRYSHSDWFLNLGYLPGGVASLQEFAVRPKQAISVGMSAETGYQNVWESQILKEISGVADFGLVLLVTGNVDTGRAWIEQVQPALNDVPFLMIASAQAAPLFEPYVQSGQIQAMLSGLADGLSYDEITKQPGDRRGYWNAYQYALIVAVAMIFIGIIFESIRSVLLRSKPEKEA
ncbi:MAG: hypothetical protein MUO76_08800 [Anaerolineaceae bacterium]|nr:hypothetical protein [Anaerolineaceae bacterium]